MLGIYFSQIFCGIGRAFLMPLTMSESSRDVPAELKSTSMGVYQSLYGIGMTLGPIVMGFFLDLSSSYLFAYAAIAVAGVIGVVWSRLVVGRVRG
jgi:MFS family permease